MITAYDNIMRTIVDIPEQDIQGLDALCGREQISRAEAIRRAVAGYLKVHRGDADAAFGLWRRRGQNGSKYQDGLTYQNDMRDEWSPAGDVPDAASIVVQQSVHEPGKES